MPVRSLTQSVLRWPKPEQVLAEAQAWAHTQQQALPSLRRVGVLAVTAAAPLPWAATLISAFALGRSSSCPCPAMRWLDPAA